MKSFGEPFELDTDTPRPQVWGRLGCCGARAPQWGQFKKSKIFEKKNLFLDFWPPDHRQTIPRVDTENVCTGHFRARGHRLGATGPQKIIFVDQFCDALKTPYLIFELPPQKILWPVEHLLAYTA